MASRQSPLGVYDIQQSANAGQTITITNELDNCVIIGMLVFGTNGCTATLLRNGNTVGSATYNTIGGLNSNGMFLNNIAQINVAASDTLTIQITNAAVTRICILTRFPDIYAWPLTVTVA